MVKINDGMVCETWLWMENSHFRAIYMTAREWIYIKGPLLCSHGTILVRQETMNRYEKIYCKVSKQMAIYVLPMVNLFIQHHLSDVSENVTHGLYQNDESYKLNLSQSN